MSNIYHTYLFYFVFMFIFCFGNNLYAEDDDKDKTKKTEEVVEVKSDSDGDNKDNADSTDTETSNKENETPATSTSEQNDVRIVDGILFINGKEIKDPQTIAKYSAKNHEISLGTQNVDSSGNLDNLIGANLLDFNIAGDCEEETAVQSGICDIKMIDGVLYKDGKVVPEEDWEEVLKINTTMEDLLDLTPNSFEEKDGALVSEQEVGKIIQQEWKETPVVNNFSKQAGLSFDDAVWNMMDGELSENQLNYIARQYEVSPHTVANHVRAIESANNIQDAASDNVGATRIKDPETWVESTLEAVKKTEEEEVLMQQVGISTTTYNKTTDIVPVNPATLVEGRKILLSNIYGEDIPAFNHYHGAWDTHKIHNYKYDLSQMRDTVEFFLTHGLNDDFKMPTMGHVTSNFGPRRWRYHNGIDLKLDKGDPVYSMFEGKVRIAQYSRSYGYVVVVRHYNGLETLYAHLSKLKVKSGDKVGAGDVVGLGGSTGRSTGNHLHLEVRYKGHPINPNELIDFNAKNLKHHTFTVNRSYFTSTNPYESVHGSSSSGGDNKYYKIRRGDTLGKIASRYGTSVKQLCRLNGISSRTTLKVGRSLRVN